MLEPEANPTPAIPPSVFARMGLACARAAGLVRKAGLICGRIKSGNTGL